MPHHPITPNLNPIEHGWAALTREMRNICIGSQRDEVVNAGLWAWEDLRNPDGRDLKSSMVASMPHLLNCVLDVGGLLHQVLLNKPLLKICGFLP